MGALIPSQWNNALLYSKVTLFDRTPQLSGTLAGAKKSSLLSSRFRCDFLRPSYARQKPDE
jgi:hypothetical protein